MAAGMGPHLSFADSFMGDEGVKILCDSLRTNHSITSVDLRGSNISERGCDHLSNVMRSHASLQALGLEWNNAGDDGASVLASALPDNQALTNLDLRNNKIGPRGAAALARALAAMGPGSRLTDVDLRWNQIGEGGLDLAKALDSNRVLVALQLDGNGVSEAVLREVADKLHANASQSAMTPAPNGRGALNGASTRVPGPHHDSISRQDPPATSALERAMAARTASRAQDTAHLKQQVRDLTAALEGEMATNESLRAKQKHGAQQIVDLAAQLSDARRALDADKSEEASAVTAVQSRLEETQLAADTQLERAAAAERRVVEASDRIAALEAQLEKERREAAAALSEADGQRRAAEAEARQSRDERSRQATAAGTDKAALQQTIAKLHAEASFLRGEVQRLHEEHAKNEAALLSRISDLEHQLGAARGDLELARDALDAGKADAAAHAREEAGRHARDVDDLKRRHDEAMGGMKTEVVRLREAMEQQVAESSRAVAEADHRASAEQRGAESLRTEQGLLRAQVEDLEAALASSKAALVEEKDETARRIKALSDDLVVARRQGAEAAKARDAESVAYERRIQSLIAEDKASRERTRYAALQAQQHVTDALRNSLASLVDAGVGVRVEDARPDGERHTQGTPATFALGASQRGLATDPGSGYRAREM